MNLLHIGQQDKVAEDHLSTREKVVVEKVVMRKMVVKIQDAHFLFDTTMQRWMHSSLHVCGIIKLSVEEKQNEGNCGTTKCMMVSGDIIVSTFFDKKLRAFLLANLSIVQHRYNSYALHLVIDAYYVQQKSMAFYDVGNQCEGS